MHTIDYVNAATTGILSPHILPIEDLMLMLSHIKEALPSTMHLLVSSENMLHFYWYLHTHVLITNKQFSLPIDVPIQNHMQQLKLHEVFTLDIPHGNFSACYDINTKYLGITQDKTMAVDISEHQFHIHKEESGQFCNIGAPFDLLPIHLPVSQLYMPKTQQALTWDTHSN